jgi:tight adherence protein B
MMKRRSGAAEVGSGSRAGGQARPRAPARRRRGDVGQVARVVQRLAVLLSAGVPPLAAWGYLREGEVPAAVAASDLPVPEAILAAAHAIPAAELSAWRGLAAAWAVASDAGAPLAPTLRMFAGSLRSLADTQRDIAVALASPRATARMVLVLPLLGVLFGVVLGFDTVHTLFGTPIGWGCLVVGGILLGLAGLWNRRLLRAAQPSNLTPGLGFDLVAIAVSGGAAFARARASVDLALDRCGLALHDDVGIEQILDLSRRAGVPAAELLRAEAEEARRGARAEAQSKAAALAVRLMLPLGICVLPAFMVLGVLPR